MTWLAISPLGSIPDEPAHVTYSAAVVRGELGLDEDWSTVTIPASLGDVSAKTCFAFKPEIAASCQPDTINVVGVMETQLATTGYPVLYYSLVGLPTLAGFNDTIWFLMRIVSIGLATLLVGISLAGSKQMLLPKVVTGFLLALTPMVSYLVASVNPNGLEIVSGITFALSLTILWLKLSKPSEISESNSLLATSFVASGIVLSNVRPYSWLLTLGIIFVALVGCRGLWQVLIAAKVRFYSLFLVLGIFSGLTWTLFIRVQQNNFAPAFIGDSDLNLVSILKEYGPRLDNYWTSTVGLFGWIDHTSFQLLEQLWISVIVIYFGLVIILSTLRQKISSALLLVGSVILAPIGIYLLLFTDGVGYQARYAMALSCSLPIFLAAFSLRNKAQEFLSLVLITPILVLLTFFSSWSKSGFRYWLGLPFRTPDGDELASATYWSPGWIAILGLIAFITFTWMILSISMSTLKSRQL